ncbi:hypothetical protein PACTADRAFT_50836 [Pachysolen tannophilus NRRL Y-2460]|uniref:Complex 1 LYR protein domain-containing protein n=1 Tax=Pachysolen tannophilus NRRL Y-2460 TaxID=669874 RepID=A0A1E4TTE7_PACTA|nr:hypothetical protein PACTADRAFT_50836 [Pachysolen tannophilus NRRL Y-2460]
MVLPLRESAMHKAAVLVLYRTLLRHSIHLPSTINEEILYIVRKEFKANRNLKSSFHIYDNLRNCYDFEKLLFEYHTELDKDASYSRISEVMKKYHKIYQDRKDIINVKKRPSINEANPNYMKDSKDLDLKFKSHQKLKSYLDNYLNQLKLDLKIPKKSKLDDTYISKILVLKTLALKTSKIFNRFEKLFGENSKPYEIKVISSRSVSTPIITLKAPWGMVGKDSGKFIHKKVQKHMQIVESIQATEKFKIEFFNYYQWEDIWEETLRRNDFKSFSEEEENYSKIKFTDFLEPFPSFFYKESAKNLEEINNHNKLMILLKDKVQIEVNEYHRLKKENFAKLVEFIDQNNDSILKTNVFNNFNKEYHLSKIMSKFGFDNEISKILDNINFEDELDEKEFCWEIGDDSNDQGKTSLELKSI